MWTWFSPSQTRSSIPPMGIATAEKTPAPTAPRWRISPAPTRAAWTPTPSTRIRMRIVAGEVNHRPELTAATARRRRQRSVLSRRACARTLVNRWRRWRRVTRRARSLISSSIRFGWRIPRRPAAGDDSAPPLPSRASPVAKPPFGSGSNPRGAMGDASTAATRCTSSVKPPSSSLDNTTPGCSSAPRVRRISPSPRRETSPSPARPRLLAPPSARNSRRGRSRSVG